MNDAIPFFSDLPVKAIPAVQRLYDDALNQGYNVAKVYSDLVSRLNAAGIAPPARKLVTQWLAAVKIGMAMRPLTPDAAIETPVSALAPIPGYFENLPDAALPALAAAWDAIQAADEAALDDADEQAFEEFFNAVLAIGHMEPSWRGFVAYAKSVRLGQVERPPRQTADGVTAIERSLQVEPEPKKRGRRAKADVFVADAVTGEGVRPEIITEADENTQEIVGVEVIADTAGAPAEPELVDGEAPVPALGALKSAAARLLDEIFVQLTANIEQTAREATARMLREMADEMELGGA